MRAFVVIATLGVVSACSSGDVGLPRIADRSPEGARHVLPRYSPDGSRIAYWSPPADSTATAWQLWVANTDLTGARPLPVSAPFFGAEPVVWSPDGSWIAAVSGQFGTADVVVVPASGGEIRRVTMGPGFEVPAAWHPDGDRLLYFASAEGGTIRSFSVSLSGGESRPMIEAETRPFIAAWSPDGSRIAYTVWDGAVSTIWLADSAGNNRRQLTTEGFEEMTESGWSPDGSHILYESRRTGTLDLWVVPADGGEPAQLTRDVRNDRSGRWSPDGKWIAFVSDRGRQTDLWVVPAGGGREYRITDTDAAEESPLWRPGTQELAFVTTSSRSGVWALSLADSVERRLTPDSVRISWFNISPDGQNLNYVADHGAGIHDLVVVPMAGGAPRTLLAGGGTVVQARWSNDGSRIVFNSDRGGSPDVWLIDAAGGAPRQLVNWPGWDTQARWSGDGSAIYFQSDRDARLGDVWMVAPDGGEAVRVTRDGGIGGLRTKRGVADIVVGLIGQKAGEFGLAKVGADGAMRVLWDGASAFVADISPNGDAALALVDQGPGVTGSMILPLNGGAARTILGPNERALVWSPDGSRILYSIRPRGAFDLSILNLSDGTTRRLTRTPEEESGAEWTPDGASVVFTRRNTVQRIHTADLTRLLRAD